MQQPAVSYAGAPVILISIDTLRADHLPAYGYEAIATPAIDALRRDAILFEKAYSPCPMTLPSHVSVLTGLAPHEHGVRNNLGYTFDGTRHDSLPKTLQRAGYATGAAVSAFVLRASTGLGPLFDFYDDKVGGASNVSIAEVAREGEATAAVASAWIERSASQPFFFFLHLFEPHWPYEGSYDQEIVRTDAIVGRFLDSLKKSGVYDRAIIVLLSDHGEGLGDHGEQEHGVFLYREAIHVPLLIKLPKGERGGSTIAQPVPLTDVTPTLAALTGAEANTKAPLLAPVPQRIYSETMLPRIHFGWSELHSLVDEKHHFIEAPRAELYDLQRDHAERTNIAPQERRLLADFRKELGGRGRLTAPAAVSAEEAKKLAALGYIGEMRTEGDLADPKDRIRDLEDLKAGRLEELLARNPRFADAWLRLAAKQEREGELDAALRSYRSAINAAPVLASQIALPIASLQLRRGQLDDAAAHARIAATTQPAAAHHVLGRIALERRDYSTAMNEARVAMQDATYRASAIVLLARIAAETNHLEDGLKLIDSVDAGTPDRDFTRGEILARMDRGAEAEAAFRSEIAAFPHNAQAYARLAILQFAMGRDPEPALRAMIRAVPSSVPLAAEVRRTLR